MCNTIEKKRRLDAKVQIFIISCILWEISWKTSKHFRIPKRKDINLVHKIHTYINKIFHQRAPYWNQCWLTAEC